MSIELPPRNLRATRTAPGIAGSKRPPGPKPRPDPLADQLQQALDRRVLIEQAKGVLIARMGVEADQAFALIRREARSRNRRVTGVAGDVIAGHLPEPQQPRR